MYRFALWRRVRYGRAMGKTGSTFDYDAVIIGAGLIGLSTADSLLAKGLSVCVTDIKSASMTGASFSNSGMIHPSQSAPWAQLGLDDHLRLSAGVDVLSLAKRSAELIAKRAEDLGLSQNGRARGCLQIFHSQKDWVAACERCDGLGVEYQRRPAGALFGDKPSLFYAGDSSGNAHDYGAALTRDIAARGGDIALGEGALPWVEDGRVIGVRLGSRNISARHTVLAAGMQSQRLAGRVGVTLPMKRAAGWAVNYARPKGVELPDYPVMEAGNCSAMSIFGETLRLSGTIAEPSAEKLISTWNALAPRLMAVLGAPLSPPWMGERPVSLTGKPFIGRTGLPNLWINTAHGHMGWTLCAGSAALLADMIVEGRIDARFSLPNAAQL